MLRQLRSRLLPTLVPIGISAALVVGGCEVSVQPDSGDRQTESRSDGGGPSEWVVAEGEVIANELVADPAFEQLVGVSAQIMGDLREAQLELSDEDVDAIARTINEPWFAETMAPGTLLGHIGGDPEHLDQVRLLIGELRVNHGLQDASPEDVGYVFELALATDQAQEKMTTAVAQNLDLTPDWGPCEAACYAIYMATFVIALGLFIVAMAVAAVTFPWGLILAAIAVAVFERAIAEAQALLELCLAECEGTADDLTLCGGDSICGPDEYCWTGVLGIGSDECRPKKDEGDTCANHEQCLSGCCKYHLWSHPVSKVCRPASQCN